MIKTVHEISASQNMCVTFVAFLKKSHKTQFYTLCKPVEDHPVIKQHNIKKTAELLVDLNSELLRQIFMYSRRFEPL